MTLFTSCLKEQPYEVGTPFEIYVQSFSNEAAKRGVDVDFQRSGLAIQFGTTANSIQAAVCLGNRTIVISEQGWSFMDEFEREALVFHELGHCELGRSHINTRLDNGEWASMMRGGLSDCDTEILNFAGTRREYYIDELFDANAPQPDWAQWSSEIIPNDNNVVLEIEEAVEFDRIFDKVSSGNFEIDLELNTDNMQGFGGFQFMGTSLRNNIRIFTNRNRDIAVDSGGEAWGFMYYNKKNHLLNPGFNRITVQRKSDFYYVFVNGQFIYWFDFFPPTSDKIASANIGEGDPLYRNITVSTLP